MIKLRKKFLYPKRSTIKVPLAVKNAIAEAIKEETIFEKLIDKKKKADWISTKFFIPYLSIIFVLSQNFYSSIMKLGFMV